MAKKGLPRAFAFKIAPEANAGKLAKLGELERHWRATLPLAFKWHWRPF